MIKNFKQGDPLDFLIFLLEKTERETNDSYLAKKMMIKYSDKSNCIPCKRSKEREGKMLYMDASDENTISLRQ
jgi:uncharacterized UBP type Zn finger protein